MTIDEFAAAFPETPITPEQIACCRYLERQGKRFLYDFGYVNAPALVWDELDRALEPACSACSALEPHVPPWSLRPQAASARAEEQDQEESTLEPPPQI